jgi:hypothetical protein
MEHVVVAAGMATALLVLCLVLVSRVPVVAAMLPMMLFSSYLCLVPSLHGVLPEGASLAFPKRLDEVFFIWSTLSAMLLGATVLFVWHRET